MEEREIDDGLLSERTSGDEGSRLLATRNAPQNKVRLSRRKDEIHQTFSHRNSDLELRIPTLCRNGSRDCRDGNKI